jgi:hypothetical protein
MSPRTLLLTLTLAATPAAFAQPDPSGIDFVTITNPGNAPWTGGGPNNNRGQVNYEYRIGRVEVTTAQWAEFMNAALDRPINDRIPHVFAPQEWGAQSAPPVNGGVRSYSVPAGREMIPTGGVDWRTSAIYCNWLHNNKASNREAFLSGAYDVSTFGYDSSGQLFTDQLTRSPGARYFIPSLDEWMKAAHFDPNRNGSGQGGWWLYSNSSDQPFAYGPPGVLVNGRPATANAGWSSSNFPGFSPFDVPLGAYVTTTSPWGLLDVAGGTSEWTEQWHTVPGDEGPSIRRTDGSGWDWAAGGADQAGFRYAGIEPTSFYYEVGFRVAAVVPSPGGGVVVLGTLLLQLRRRLRNGG